MVVLFGLMTGWLVGFNWDDAVLKNENKSGGCCGQEQEARTPHNGHRRHLYPLYTEDSLGVAVFDDP
jgi:hypothetical protein